VDVCAAVRDALLRGELSRSMNIAAVAGEWGELQTAMLVARRALVPLGDDLRAASDAAAAVASATWADDASGTWAMTSPVAGLRMSSGAPSPGTKFSPIRSRVFIMDLCDLRSRAGGA